MLSDNAMKLLTKMGHVVKGVELEPELLKSDSGVKTRFLAMDAACVKDQYSAATMFLNQSNVTFIWFDTGLIGLPLKEFNRVFPEVVL